MKGYKHLTAEQKQQILDMYQRTQIVSVTANDCGASVDQVRSHLKRNGIKPSMKQERGACHQNRDRLLELAAQGASLSEIARDVGTNKRHVRDYIERHQIPHTPWDRTAPENNSSWRGGRTIDKDGYVLLKSTEHPRRNRNGYMREHRLVMEQTLGRLLTADEVVHHKDGNPQNNDPQNLEVYERNTQHLAETLKGQRPNWTPEGIEAMRVNGLRAARRLHGSSPEHSEPDDSPLPQT